MGLLVALFIGVAIGSSGKTTVRTRTTTRDATRTVIHTRTVAKPVARPACKRAISDARTVALIAGEGFKTASQWPPLLSKLVTAVEDVSVSQVDAIVTQEKSLNGSMTADVPLMRAAAADFNKDAAGCK